MAARIRELAAIHPDGARMQVSVIAPPYEQWPLPWYLRAMPNVGYWTAPGDPVALQAPVIVASMEHTAALDASLGDRYVSEFFGLRPEVLLALYVERGLWERFLARAALSGSAPGCGNAGARAVPRVAGQRPLWHCGATATCDDTSGTGPGRALLQRGGPPRPRGVPAVRHDPPGRAAGDGRRWECGRDGGHPRADARGGTCGGDDVRHTPRRGKAEAVRAGILAGLERSARRWSGSSTPTCPRRCGRSTTSWPCSATRPTVEFVLGSRVMLMGRDVRRKADATLPRAGVRHGGVPRARPSRLRHAVRREDSARERGDGDPVRRAVPQPLDLRRRADRAIPAAAGRAGRARPPRSPLRARRARVARQARIEAALVRLCPRGGRTRVHLARARRAPTARRHDVGRRRARPANPASDGELPRTADSARSTVHDARRNAPAPEVGLAQESTR